MSTRAWRLANGRCGECSRIADLGSATRCPDCRIAHAASQKVRNQTRANLGLTNGGGWKRWIAADPAKFRAYAKPYTAIRQASRRAHSGMLTLMDWLKIKGDQDGKCFDCGERKKLTVGHVLPVSRGGSSFPRNIVGQCQACNSRQGSKIHWSFMTARCVGEAVAGGY